MSEQLTLPAEARERAGKGASRALRREGRVPAVIYGEKKEPLSVHVEEKLLAKMLSTGHFMNSVIMVEVGGKPNRTLPKDVQFHPVTSRPIHVDFVRIGEHAQVHVNVPVRFVDEEQAPGIKRGGVLNVVRIGEHAQVHVNVPVRFVDEEQAPGIKRGGVLNVVRHELELVCDAASIPSEIVVSLSGLEIGDAVHISNVTLPEGAKPTIDDRDFTVATVVAPSAMKAEEEEAAPAGEVPTVEEGEEGEGEGEAAAEGGGSEE